jgi:undecaprenyl-diphosphatase
MTWLFVWIATQIIAESFPISSSSHVRLLEMYLHRIGFASWLSSVPKYFVDFLHLPTLCILLLFFGNRWLSPLLHLHESWSEFAPFVLRVGLACGVTIAFYIIWSATGWRDLFPMKLGLLITAALLLSLLFVPQTSNNQNSEQLPAPTISTALWLGGVQGLALLPGISRMAATFVAARWKGLSSEHALEFSCAIEVPLIGAAVIRSLLELVASPNGIQLLNGPSALVMLFSGIIAYYCFYLTWLLAISDRFWWFGLYVAGLLAVLAV